VVTVSYLVYAWCMARASHVDRIHMGDTSTLYHS